MNKRIFSTTRSEHSDSTAITYSVIAGSLPAGMQVTSTGLLTGTPAEVAKRTLYTFVVRATAGTTITDRTFSLRRQGCRCTHIHYCIRTTATGRFYQCWTVLGHRRSKCLISRCRPLTQTQAAGQTLFYEIVQGSLPPGVTMSKTGLISGIVQLTDDQRYGERGGYDVMTAQEEYDSTCCV
jgi:hypothetical protein